MQILTLITKVTVFKDPSKSNNLFFCYKKKIFKKQKFGMSQFFFSHKTTYF